MHGADFKLKNGRKSDFRGAQAEISDGELSGFTIQMEGTTVLVKASNTGPGGVFQAVTHPYLGRAC